MFFIDGLLDAGPEDATLVFTQTYSSSSPTIGTLGAIAGDLAVVLLSAGTMTSPASGWSTVTLASGLPYEIWWKQLTASDLTTTFTKTATFPEYVVAIYRGPISLQSVRTGSGTAENNSVAGVTKSVNHAGFAVATLGRGIEAYAKTPATFTQRSSSITRVFSSQSYTGTFWDRLSPPNPSYTDGTAFTYGLPNSSSSGTTYINVLELLS